MEGNKTLSSRRSSSNRERYLSAFSDEDFEEALEVEGDTNSLNKSSSEEGSVFYNAEDKGASTHTDKHVLRGKGQHSSRSTTSKERKFKSLGSDHVDMSINRDKDIAKNFKRGTSEHLDFVYQFNWIDMLIGIGSIVVYFVDIVTDIKVAVDYFLDSQWLYGAVTTALIIGPSLVTCCFGLHWYYIDYKTEKMVIKESMKKNRTVHHVTSSCIWFLRFFFTILQFGPVVRTVQYLHYGCMSRSQKVDDKARRRYHWWMLYEEVDNCLLRLFESFLESAPQLSWQLYLTIKTKPGDSAIGTTTRTASLLSSWFSLAVSLVSYHRSLRNSRVDKHKMKVRSVPLFFLWRACETGGRVLCLAMFASAFDSWVFGIVLFHWLVVSVWLMNQKTTFYQQRYLEKVFNVICGYVMIFCFLNLREGHTRYRFLIFYLLMYAQNFFMLAFWFRFTPDLGAWFHLWGFIVVLIFFILHVFFQLLYYWGCHPTGPITCCLPCDRYTFYESVCYDVRPQVDDGVGSPSKRYSSKEMVQDSDSVPRLMDPQAQASGDARTCQEITVIVEDSHGRNGQPPHAHHSHPHRHHKKIEHHARAREFTC